MKQLIHIALFLLFSSSLLAQPGQNRERIHAIKVGYLTDRLKLSSQEAERFWPVYNSYEEDFFKLRQEYRRKYVKDGKEHLDPAEAQRFIDEDLEYREKMLDLRKRYKDQFLKVIPASKLAELYQAEADFKEMLIKRLEQRRGGGRPGGRPGRR
jgi:hypothetical protein